MKSIVLATVALAATAVEAATSLPGRRSSHLPPRVKIAGRSRLADDSVAFSPEHQALAKRQLPAKATGVKKVTSPNGHAVRYKELTDKGICETTKGVRSFSGYIDLSPTVHVFFMFYNSRNNPSKDPFTLWLNGPPVSSFRRITDAESSDRRSWIRLAHRHVRGCVDRRYCLTSPDPTTFRARPLPHHRRPQSRQQPVLLQRILEHALPLPSAQSPSGSHPNSVADTFFRSSARRNRFLVC